MNDYAAFDDHRIKHMEMIQAVIGRLGNDSFLVKGWAITVAGVFFGFAVNSENGSLAMASVLPTLSFWGLDAYFLRSERLFRALYDGVRSGSRDMEPFYMGATSPDFIELVSKGPDSDTSSLRKTSWRPTLRYFYGALIGSGLLLTLIICIG